MSLYYITAQKPKLASNDHNILGGKLTNLRRNAQTHKKEYIGDRRGRCGPSVPWTEPPSFWLGIRELEYQILILQSGTARRGRQNIPAHAEG